MFHIFINYFSMTFSG